MIFKTCFVDKVSFLNYLFIGSILLDDAFGSFWGVKGMPAISLGIFIINFILYSSKDRSAFGRCLTNPPVIIWLIWCFYSWLNWELKGLAPPDDAALYRYYLSSFVLPLLTLSVIYFEGSKNLRMITLMVIIFFSIYCICGITLQERGTGNLVDGTAEARGRMLLGNRLPLKAICLTFVICFAYVNNYIKKEYFIILLALAIGSIFFYATRKAFGGWIIIVFSLCWVKFDFRKPKTILAFLVIFFVGYFGFDFVLQKTLLGARMQRIDYDAADVRDWVKIPSYLTLLGDRAAQYVLGWKLFLENPITGVGIQNFQYFTGYKNRLHTEYMVQLCEGGIVGFFIWVLFMKGLFRSVLSALKNKARSVSTICLGGLVCVLFIDLTAWTYQSSFFFVLYGLILAYSQPIIINRKWIERLAILIKLRRI